MKGKKDKGPSVKKPIFKKWWFWVIIVILLSAIFGNMGSGGDTTPDTTQNPEQSEPVDNAQSVGDSADRFVEEVKTAIQGAISSKDESITDVVLQNGDLCVYVDFSEKDPAPLTLEDLALARTSSITDAILELKDYDSLWETITVDFGAIGHITNSKENMEINGAGRHFPADNALSGDNSSESVELSMQSQTVCRALTNLFVKNVVGEEWHMLAFSVESYELDENENGTIEVLYMPPNAGNGETKVNLTIEKKDDSYAITYSLLAGVYEVDLSTVSNNYKTLTD